MTFNTHRTLSPDLFSHGMVHSVLGLSIHSSETVGKQVFVNLRIWAWWQSEYFPPVNVGASNLPEKHTGPFFSSFQQQFWSNIWVLVKKQSSCHFLLRSHLRVQFQLIRVTTGMALSTHRTLSPDLFSQGILQYILGVSLHNSDVQGNILLWILDLGSVEKLVFSPCNSLIVAASNWTERHPGSYFSS